jgi:hypothetical protein
VLAHEMGHAIGFGHVEGGVMDENRLAGERTTPERWIEPLAASRERGGVATGIAAQALAAPAPVVAIDWRAPATQAAASTATAAAPAETRATAAWQQRFVNQLGAQPRADPNAGLKVHLPIAPKLSRL